MIVAHAPGTGLTLVDPNDFKGFKLRISGDEARPSMPGVSFVDDGNVLIGIDAVRALPGVPDTPEWRASFQAMVDYAARKGWIDEATHSIRAHVERAP
jgi:hypothetical protein